MDQRQIGAFVAQLRREKNWTQEELGARLGVTNKTVSRWENGNYMPDIEMLALLGREFGVSLNELVQGRRLEAEDSFRAAAEENLTSALKRPTARFWRWLERNLLTVVVALLLGLLLVTALGLYWNYKADNPADLAMPGSYSTGPSGQGVCLVFDRESRFWRYRNGGEYLETGRYTCWEDRLTVTTDEGRSYELLIKGNRIYEPDSQGGWTAYTRFHDDPLFAAAQPRPLLDG